jgi:predicted site-specific integrase-resolvase
VKLFTETASGINENRKQLKKLLEMTEKGEVDVVLIEFKDRLARFGYQYIVQILESHGARVEVVTQLDSPKDATQELIEDMLAIVTCFSAKLYGQRSQQFKKKVEQALKEVKEEHGGSDKNHKTQDNKPQ